MAGNVDLDGGNPLFTIMIMTSLNNNVFVPLLINRHVHNNVTPGYKQNCLLEKTGKRKMRVLCTDAMDVIPSNFVQNEI